MSEIFYYQGCCEPDIFISAILKYICSLCFIVFSFTSNSEAGVNVSVCIVDSAGHMATLLAVSVN